MILISTTRVPCRRSASNGRAAAQTRSSHCAAATHWAGHGDTPGGLQYLTLSSCRAWCIASGVALPSSAWCHCGTWIFAEVSSDPLAHAWEACDAFILLGAATKQVPAWGTGNTSVLNAGRSSVSRQCKRGARPVPLGHHPIKSMGERPLKAVSVQLPQGLRPAAEFGTGFTRVTRVLRARAQGPRA